MHQGRLGGQLASIFPGGNSARAPFGLRLRSAVFGSVVTANAQLLDSHSLRCLMRCRRHTNQNVPTIIGHSKKSGPKTTAGGGGCSLPVGASSSLHLVVVFRV